MALKQIIAAFAFVSAVAAQSACSASGTLTIQNSGDATALASCETFSGSIAVATGTTDAINIPDVRAVTGNIVVENAPNITTFGADSIREIGGSFTLNNCQILSSLNWPELSVVGDLDFEALPNLQALGFTTSIEEATTVNIQNTFLTSLNGINLQSVASVTIVNNPLLQDVSMQVSNISQSLTIASNGDRITASFPNLETAQNLTFRDCPSVSIPSLSNVTGSLGFYENTFQSLSTPNLTLVGGTLAFVSNTQLTNISMPQLVTIGGGFQVQNNTDLDDLTNSFPDLKTIGGALDWTGNFTNVTLPSLADCKGAFNLQSSNDITSDCNTFKAESGSNSVIKGKFTCAGDQSNPGASGSTSTASGSSTATKKSEARNLDISTNAVIGVGSVFAAMLGML